MRSGREPLARRDDESYLKEYGEEERRRQRLRDASNARARF